MFVALVLMCAVLQVSNPKFLGMSNALTTSRQISMLGIYAIGISFVIITGGIDLSVGSVVGLTGVLIAKFSSTEFGGLGLSLWLGIPIALAIAALIGLAQGLIITRLKLQPFIVTLGFMLLLRGVSQTVVKGASISLGASSLRDLSEGGLIHVSGNPLLPYTVLIFTGAIVLGAIVLHTTVFGRYVYAIGGNRDAAEYSGINVRRIETLTYVISSLSGGVAGVLYAAYIGEMDQSIGIAFELYAIAAAVLGGVSLRGGEGSILGIVIGSAVYQVIYNGINMFQIVRVNARGQQQSWRLDENWRFIIVGGVILTAVIADQVVHLVRENQRTRRANVAAPSSSAPPA